MACLLITVQTIHGTLSVENKSQSTGFRLDVVYPSGQAVVLPPASAAAQVAIGDACQDATIGQQINASRAEVPGRPEALHADLCRRLTGSGV